MKKKILIVDDDAAIREAMSKVLRAENYEVVLAAAGEQFEAGEIDLLLLDLGLRTQNGWDVFEHLTSEHPLVPIIVLTGQASQYPLPVAAGVGAVMEKPLEVSRLLQTMQELLTEPQGIRQHRLGGGLDDGPQIASARAKFLEPLRERQSAQWQNKFGKIGLEDRTLKYDE